MGTNALDVLACPYCSDGVDRKEGPNGLPVALVCKSQNHTIPIHEGIPDFVLEDRARQVNAFATSYAKAWHRDGWGGSDASYLLALPHRDRTGRRRAEWKVKARSMEALLHELGAGKGRRAVDLGAGVGWLSYHLARRGFVAYAVDVVTDDRVGLGAASAYLRNGTAFERVRAELESPPFQPQSIDVAVCNASLHYAGSLPLVVSRIARILAPGGLFVVMNSPVHRDRTSALRAQADFRNRLLRLGATQQVAEAYHHLLHDELKGMLEEHFERVTEVPFWTNIWFTWSRAVKARLLQLELASFPIFMATK